MQDAWRWKGGGREAEPHGACVRGCARRPISAKRHHRASYFAQGSVRLGEPLIPADKRHNSEEIHFYTLRAHPEPIHAPSDMPCFSAATTRLDLGHLLTTVPSRPLVSALSSFTTIARPRHQNEACHGKR